jgi:hypothetical protein
MRGVQVQVAAEFEQLAKFIGGFLACITGEQGGTTLLDAALEWLAEPCQESMGNPQERERYCILIHKVAANLEGNRADCGPTVAEALLERAADSKMAVRIAAINALGCNLPSLLEYEQVRAGGALQTN